jgi:5'-deoxynucleotidase YfbR-like HD superfamily hydrolase
MQTSGLTPESIRAIIDLGKFSLAFGMVSRITCHPDGTTFESDTDHTVMLGLVACAFAERFAPELDRGKIAQFALVHDLVEVYAGDTATARIMSDADHVDKEEREAIALARIREEFDGQLPWIGETIASYESLDTPEARFVKVVDKALPKITNILNGGVTFKGQKHDAESGKEFLSHQQEKLAASYGKDQPEAMALLRSLGEEMIEAIFP